MRWLRRLLRPVWPSGSVLFGWSFLYATTEAPAAICWWFGVPNQFNLPEHPASYLLRFSAVGYGMYRAVHFHPANDPGYRKWLEATPWNSRKPLPLGPVELVWQDLLLLGLMSLVALFHAGPDPLKLLTLMLGAYLAWSMFPLFATGEWPAGYAIAFGLGLLVVVWTRPAPCALVAIGLYVIGYLGLRRSLTRFPWPSHAPEVIVERIVKGQETTVGWPYNRLAPKGAYLRPSMPAQHVVLLSLLAGWWIYAATALVHPIDRFALVVMTHGVAVLAFAFGRAAIYMAYYEPPISFWGRLVTLRWIIPGYDKVLLAPIATLAVGISAPLLSFGGGLPALVALPLSTAMTMLVALTAGPSLRAWRLTGQHRTIPAGVPGTSFIQVG